MSSFAELARDRYSVRAFAPTPVEPDKVEAILRAGQAAPTACNLQPQRILALTSPEALARLDGCKSARFGETLAFLVCYDAAACWVRACDGAPSGEVDAAIVATHMMMQAADLGIGSTWVMNFRPEAVTAAFALPEGTVPLALLVMGYPAPEAAPSPRHAARKDLSETVTFL